MAALVLGLAVLMAGGAVMAWVPSERGIGAVIALLGTGLAVLAVKSMIRRHGPARQTVGAATVESKESLAMVATDWVLALVLPGLFVPVMWQSLQVSSHRWDMFDKVGALAFLGACVLWIAWTMLKTIEALRFRRVRLELDTWPLRIGEPLSGHVVLANGAERLSGIDVKLVLIGLWYERQPDKDQLWYQDDRWQGATLAMRARHADTGAFGFSMLIPAHLPETHWRRRSDWNSNTVKGLEPDRLYHSWELRISASAGSRAHLERRFEVTVEKAAAAGSVQVPPDQQAPA